MGSPVSTSMQVNFFNVTGTQINAEMKTDNLYLRSVKREDLSNYIKLFSDIETMRKYTDNEARFKSEGEDAWKKKQTENITKRIETLVKRWEQNNPFSAFAIFKGSEAKDDQFIGHVVAGFGDNDGESEAALVIKKEEWKQGYGTEAVKAMRAYLSVVRDLDYKINGHPFTGLVASARLDNDSSIKIMESAGMKPRGEPKVIHGDMRQEYYIAAKDL